MIVASDTSPLIALAQLGLPTLLPSLFERIHVPVAVWHEFSETNPSSIRSSMVDSQWFVVHEVRLAVPEVSRFASLNKGETEAISLAITIGADALLMDEAPGRIAARSLGISVLGTAGLLVIAKNQGYIAAVRPFLDDLVNAYRFRLSKAIYKSVLQAAGELRDND